MELEILSVSNKRVTEFRKGFSTARFIASAEKFAAVWEISGTYCNSSPAKSTRLVHRSCSISLLNHSASGLLENFHYLGISLDTGWFNFDLFDSISIMRGHGLVVACTLVGWSVDRGSELVCRFQLIIVR